jgi:ATP-dependent Zn protease
MQAFIDILVSWAPMFLLIGVWIYFMRRMGGIRQWREEWPALMRTYTTEHVEQLRRQTETLDRIARALEARGERLSHSIGAAAGAISVERDT